MLKILLIQGPNMSYLGRRQPELYGTTTAAEAAVDMLAGFGARSYVLGLEAMLGTLRTET